MKIESYVLITPARNEEACIERTIQSVIKQAVLPARWIIVSDASTDRTDEIVRFYSAEYTWIEFIRKERQGDHYFASLINTFYVGYEHLGNFQYDFIGKLDADVLLGSHYYEIILQRFRENPKLGVAGGKVIENYQNKKFRIQCYKNSVAGSIHLFRKECFQAIGGFCEMKEGGYDAVAEVTARMKGWETKTFFDIDVYHLKPLNISSGSPFRRSWQNGKRDYFLGNHPLFEVAKCCYRFFEKPYVLGTLVRLTGFFLLWIKRTPIIIPREVVEYKRREQLKRLCYFF
jgi:biofilm PGA synthesis N-glycosyltransferase PgaC